MDKLEGTLENIGNREFYWMIDTGIGYESLEGLLMDYEGKNVRITVEVRE